MQQHPARPHTLPAGLSQCLLAASPDCTQRSFQTARPAPAYRQPPGARTSEYWTPAAAGAYRGEAAVADEPFDELREEGVSGGGTQSEEFPLKTSRRTFVPPSLPPSLSLALPLMKENCSMRGRNKRELHQ